MDRNLRLTFRKGDLFAILPVVLTAAVIMALFVLPGNSAQDNTAQIFQDGRLIREISLEGETRITVEGEYTNVICVENGRAGIVESDCPGGDCLHSGWISAPGRSIVCLPNRVEIRIAGSSDVDFVVG